MIRLYHIIYIMLVMMFFSSCSESDFSGTEVASLSERYISASETQVNFTSTASTKTIDVISHTTPWKVASHATWISLSEEGGDGNCTYVPLSVSVQENPSGDTIRAHAILIESAVPDWNHIVPILVSQSSATPYIIPDFSNIELPGRETTQEIHISSNTDWQPNCDQSFLSVSRVDDKLILHATENTDTESGRFEEVFLSGATTASIFVVQEPSDIKAASDTLFFEKEAASYSLSVDSDLPWTATTNYSWIQVSPSSGKAGLYELSVSVTPNTTTSSREGSVYLKINGKSIKIPVFQKGYYVETDISTIEFGSHGGIMELGLSTNDVWHANLSNNDWLTCAPNSGENTHTLILNATDNATTVSRNASLIISTAYSGDIDVEIRQNARYLRASSKSISFFGKGGTSSPIYIYTDAKYKVEKYGDWFSVKEQDGVIQVIADINDSGKWREGRITLSATDLKQGELNLTIPVTQAIDGLTFSKETYRTDIDYNLLNSHNLIITILSYNSETNYNESGINGFVKDIYNNRGDINNSGNSDGINKDPYADPDNTGNSINRDNYNNDNNYDE